MSDEVEITDGDWEAARNTWEAACLQDLYYTPVEGVDLLQMPEGRIALALTQRHAAGYQAAIADVVEWLRARAANDIASSANCRRGNAGKTLTRFAQRRIDDADEITSRFGPENNT